MNEKNEFCRCCLATDCDLCDMISVEFENGGKQYSYIDGFIKCVGLSRGSLIAEIDESPLICNTCILNLESAFSFRQLCRISDKILHDKYENKNAIDADVAPATFNVYSSATDMEGIQPLCSKPVESFVIISSDEDDDSDTETDIEEKIEFEQTKNDSTVLKACSCTHCKKTHKPVVQQQIRCMINECRIIFTNRTDYERHVDSHGNKLLHEATNLIGKPKKQSRKALKYKCEQCHKEFAFKNFFTEHMKLHEIGNAFKCKVKNCGRAYPSFYKLKQHVLTSHHDKSGLYYLSDMILAEFENNNQNYTYIDGYFECSGIPQQDFISDFDEYPKICKLCMFNLETAFTFRSLCQQANAILHQQLTEDRKPLVEDVKAIRDADEPSSLSVPQNNEEQNENNTPTNAAKSEGVNNNITVKRKRTNYCRKCDQYVQCSLEEHLELYHPEFAEYDFICLQILLKYTFLLAKKEQWRQIIEQVENFYNDFTDQPKPSFYVHKYCQITKTMTKGLYFLYFLAGVQLVGFCFLMEDPLKLPVVYHYPYLPLENPLVWWFNFSEQTFYTWIAVHACCAIDTFFIMLILNACCRSEVIVAIISEINEIYAHQTDSKESADEREQRVADILKTVICQHVNLKNYMSAIEKQFSFSFLCVFMLSRIIIVMSLNIIAKSSLTNVYLLLIGALVQLFLFCFYGNKLLLQSETLFYEVWNVEWYKMSIRNQKTYLILLHAIQDPLQVSVIFSPVNLETFLDIIKSSYRYFAILQNFN